MPVYNSKKKIRRSVNSILEQTYKDFELIIVNDGSTDNTEKVLNVLSKRDKRIKVFTQENKGPGAARNKGLENAKGKYIGFVDADDWIEKNIYKELLEVIKHKSCEVAMCDYYDENNKVKNFNYEDEYTFNKKEIKNNFIPNLIKKKSGFCSVVNKLYLKSIIDDNNITFKTNFKKGEDTYFNMDYFINVNKCVLINKRYYHYIENKKSIMRSYDKNLKKYIVEDYKYNLKYLKRNNLDNSNLINILNNRNIRSISSILYNSLESTDSINDLYNQLLKLIEDEDMKYLLKKTNIRSGNIVQQILLLLFRSNNRINIYLLSIILYLRKYLR
jgi:glycosyltransferase involved in cell wall biosynthesis